MADHLLSLGMFVFGMDAIAFSELDRRASFRHATSDVYGARARGQYLGAGEEGITLTGVLVPEIMGSYSDIETLRAMGLEGDLHSLVTGDGEVLGTFRIINVDDRWRGLIAGGRGRAADFAVDLQRAD